MKRKQKLLSVIVAGCASAIASPILAQSSSTQPTISPTSTINTVQSGFRCDTSGDLPTTLYQSTQGTAEPWIKWQSDHFSGSGWSPEARCQEVSSRLETYRQNKQLKYVTLGTVNNQSVICVASQEGGKCEGIIYTLKPGQDGLQALNNLFAWRKGEQGLESNYESVTAIPYIDVGARLDNTTTQPMEKSTLEDTQEPHREL
jgi:hypothetical protein